MNILKDLLLNSEPESVIGLCILFPDQKPWITKK